MKGYTMEGMVPEITEDHIQTAIDKGAPEEIMEFLRERAGKGVTWKTVGENVPPIPPLANIIMRSFIKETGAPAVRLLDETGKVVAMLKQDGVEIPEADMPQGETEVSEVKI